MNRKRLLLGTHLLFWFGYGAMLSTWMDWKDQPFAETSIDLFLSLIVRILPFYLNYFILMPRLFDIRRPLKLMIWLITAFFSYALWWTIFRKGLYLFLGGYNPTALDLTQVVIENGLICIGVSMGLRMAYQWMKNEERVLALQSQKLSTSIATIRTKIDFPELLAQLEILKCQAIETPKSVYEPIIELSDQLREKLYGSDINKQIEDRDYDKDQLHSHR